MMERDIRFPVMLGDGRTRPMTPEFIIDYWKAIWDSFIGLIESLEKYDAQNRLNQEGKQLLQDCYDFLEAHPELVIEDRTTLNHWGDKLQWPEWFCKATRTNGKTGEK